MKFWAKIRQVISPISPRRGNPPWWSRRVVGVLAIATIFLTGCVDYKVGIQFDNQTHGTIVQNVRLSDKLMAFNREAASAWLDSIAKRTRNLGGKVRSLSEQEIEAKMSFSNAAELEEKLNTFFHPIQEQNQTAAASDGGPHSSESQPESRTPKEAATDTENQDELPQIGSNLKINQNNFLLVLRNRFVYDIDLRSLAVLSSEGNILVSPGSLVDLKLTLQAPWGLRSVEKHEYAISPQMNLEGNQLTWKLQPGKQNHLEAIFWIPSPIGIGAVAIAILVGIGFWLKYQLLPFLGFGKKKAKPQTQ
jgi:hypothetical protein